jgi:hypothetical protein
MYAEHRVHQYTRKEGIAQMPSPGQEPLDVLSPDGNYLAREVFSIVFYIRRPHVEVGAQIEEAIKRFGGLVSFTQLRYFADNEGEWQDLLEQDLDTRLTDQWGSFADTINANVILRGDGLGVPDFYLRYSGNMRAGQGAIASYFRCWVPKAYWEGHREELNQFADSLAADLPFGFGYASLAVTGNNQHLLQKLANRYAAADISNPLAIALDIGDMAGGCYWTTYLGQALTTSVQGVDGLRSALPQEIAINSLPDGKCRLQLGPEPTLGDVNRREDVSPYRTLAAYFRSYGVLHVPKRVVYFQDEAGTADSEGQEKWHRRFIQ